MEYRLGIDIGGTFTDFALFDAKKGTLSIHKQLTTPDDPSRAVLEGTDNLLARHNLELSEVAEIVHGTTLVTNAVIERKGARTGMLTTRGFRDILDMRQEKRYDVFDLRLEFPTAMIPRRMRAEVDERCHYDGSIETQLDLDTAKAALTKLVNEHEITSLAICLLHSYSNPIHEQSLREMALAAYPELSISLSSDVSQEWREYERFTSTCINAFTQPLLDQYLGRLEYGLKKSGFTGRLFVMSSSGGTLTTNTARQLPIRVIESGPAAGAQMSAFHSRALGQPELLSFDMGGTTAKGALIRGGQAIKVYHQEIARAHGFKAGSGLPVQSPVIDMIEIGAGGGSIAQVDMRNTIRVGPQSAGANPGPACYGQGGKLATLTDANLILGYLDPSFFLGGEMSLDTAAAELAITDQIAEPLNISLARAAWGIHEIINEDVARAFRIHASERGFDYRDSSMVAFGGSGPVHAMGVARKLGIPKVIFPVAAGVMSALGLLASPLNFEVARTRQIFVSKLAQTDFDTTFADLEAESKAPLLAADISPEDIAINYRLDMRYHGQAHEIEVNLETNITIDTLTNIFTTQYEKIYGTNLIGAQPVITTWKVEASAKPPQLKTRRPIGTANLLPKVTRDAYFGGSFIPTPVYDRLNLATGEYISGPAFIEERESTVVLGVEDSIRVDEFGNLIADLTNKRNFL